MDTEDIRHVTSQNHNDHKSRLPHRPNDTPPPSSLRELLVDLDAAGIKYSPRATRQELQQQWREQQKQSKTGKSDSNGTMNINDDDENKERHPMTTSPFPKTTGLVTAAAEIMQQGSETHSETTPVMGKNDPQTFSSEPSLPRQKLPLSSPPIVAKDEDFLASPFQLDTLLSKSSDESSYSSSTAENTTSKPPTFTRTDEAAIDENTNIPPLTELIQYLDQHNIRYSARSTRDELEQLWRKAHPTTNLSQMGTSCSEIETKPSSSRRNSDMDTIPTNQETNRQPRNAGKESMGNTDTNSQAFLDEAQQQRRRQRRQHRRQRQQLKEPDSILNSIQPPSSLNLEVPQAVVADTAHYVTRKARQVSRRARDWMAVDEDGVRNAAYSYVSKSNQNDKKKHKRVDDDDGG